MREGALIGVLGSLGIIQEKALALSFVIFGIQIISSLLGGAFIWLKPSHTSLVRNTN